MELRVFVVEDLQRMLGLLDELFTSLGGIRVVGTAATEADTRSASARPTMSAAVTWKIRSYSPLTNR